MRCTWRWSATASSWSWARTSGRAGGVFRATAGLLDRFGPDRCVDTPLAEAGILGTAVGLAMAGWRPVCEMQYESFSYPCLDQLICHVGRYRWRTTGRWSSRSPCACRPAEACKRPSSTRTRPRPTTCTRRASRWPSRPRPPTPRACWPPRSATPDPVVILEPKLLYRSPRGEVPEGEHVVPLGNARIARQGDDVTADRLRLDGARRPRPPTSSPPARRGARPAQPQAARRGARCSPPWATRAAP